MSALFKQTGTFSPLSFWPSAVLWLVGQQGSQRAKRVVELS
jgi:hypothetical protein